MSVDQEFETLDEALTGVSPSVRAGDSPSSRERHAFRTTRLECRGSSPAVTSPCESQVEAVAGDCPRFSAAGNPRECTIVSVFVGRVSAT